MRNNSQSNSCGFTVIEMLVVLVIVGLVVVAIFKVVPSITKNVNVDNFRTNHSVIVDAVSKYFASFNFDYTGLTTASMVDGKVIPKDFASGTGTSSLIITNYPTASATVDVDATNTRVFVLTYAGLPSEDCTSIAAAVQSRAVKLQLGSTGSLTTVKDLMAATPIQLTPATLATACAGISGPVFSMATTQQQ